MGLIALKLYGIPNRMKTPDDIVISSNDVKFTTSKVPREIAFWGCTMASGGVENNAKIAQRLEFIGKKPPPLPSDIRMDGR